MLLLISASLLTHWGRVTHICVGKLTTIGSDNGLSPGRRQAIIWTNAGILLIRPLGTNLNEILIEIQTFSLKKIRLKMSSAKWRPFHLSLNVLSHPYKSNSSMFSDLVRRAINKWIIFLLTHWGQDKMAAIFLTYSNAFSWMKITGIIFWLKFHWNMFPMVQ